MSDFSEATAVRAEGNGNYAIDIDGTWSVGNVPNGGYLQALLLRAVAAESAQPHPVAATAHFLAPPTAGSAVVRVEHLRNGRTTATLRATLVQDGRPIVDLTATTGTLDRGATAEWSGPPPEAVAPIDECVPAVVDLPDGTHVGLLEHVDLRLDPQTLGGSRAVPRVRSRCVATCGCTTAPNPIRSCSHSPWTPCRRPCSGWDGWAGPRR